MFSALLLSLLTSTSPDPAWQGCWANAGGEEVFWFDGARCGWLREGKPSFYRVRHTPGRARLEKWGRFTEVTGSLVDGTSGGSEESGERVLTLTVDGREIRLTPFEVPVALRVEPYDLPSVGEVDLDEDTIAMIEEELSERRREDQRVRFAFDRGAGNPAEARRVDEDNTEFVRTIVHELGWIDAERFGSTSADAAFLLVQHSDDLRLMRTALPFIEVDVREGRLDGQAFALLYDRFQLRLGYLQRYGSQVGTTADGQLVSMPTEDEENVDERRASLGMAPLADYLAFFENRPGGPVVPLSAVANPIEAASDR